MTETMKIAKLIAKRDPGGSELRWLVESLNADGHSYGCELSTSSQLAARVFKLGFVETNEHQAGGFTLVEFAAPIKPATTQPIEIKEIRETAQIKFGCNSIVKCIELDHIHNHGDLSESNGCKVWRTFAVNISSPEFGANLGWEFDTRAEQFAKYAEILDAALMVGIRNTIRGYQQDI